MYTIKRIKNSWSKCLFFLFFLSPATTAIGQNTISAYLENQVITVGDTIRPENLYRQIQQAYDQGAKKIIIRPGKYLLPDERENIFLLDRWKNVVVSAYGVTLISNTADEKHVMFHLKSCKNVTVEGGIFSQTIITGYQGRITATGTDGKGHFTADWMPDAGYPVPVIEKGLFPGCLNVVDKRSRKLKTGIGDHYEIPMQTIAGGAFRVVFPKANLNIEKSDWVVGRNGEYSFKFFLDNSTNCTIKDVVLLRNGFAAIREEAGGGNHLLHCTWDLGPRPDQAIEDPLITSSADGFHSTNANPGTDIENCIFKGILLDDCIAIHGSFSEVISSHENTFTCDGKENKEMKTGHELRFTNDQGFIEGSRIVKLDKTRSGDLLVTIDRKMIIPPGTKFSDLQQCGQGYKIIGCNIGGTRSRGVLLKGDNGLIRNNIFDNCGMAAISLGPEFYWNEANYVHNVRIENNTLKNNGNTGGGGGVIFVHGEGAMGNKNIVIKNNLLQFNLIAEICIEWCDTIAMLNNKIERLSALPAGIAKFKMLNAANCGKIQFLKNKMIIVKSGTANLITRLQAENIDANFFRNVNIPPHRRQHIR